ncbi:hypothetical protein D3C80_2054190 [compost metagenome]
MKLPPDITATSDLVFTNTVTDFLVYTDGLLLMDVVKTNSYVVSTPVAWNEPGGNNKFLPVACPLTSVPVV